MASAGMNELPPNLVRQNVEWDNNPYTVLIKFQCRLQGEELRHASPVPLPDDICQHIGKIVAQDIQSNSIRLYSANEYIMATLRKRMQDMEIGKKYLESTRSNPDAPYTNVIEYFGTAYGSEFLKSLITANDRFLLDNVLPWLGLTEWNNNPSWRAIQMSKFKSILINFLRPPTKEPTASPVSSAITPDDYNSLYDALSEPARKKNNHKGGIGRKRSHTRKLGRKRKSKSKSKSKSSKRRR